MCGRFIVRVISGQVSPPNLAEKVELDGQSGFEIESGWRLACQAEVRIFYPGNLSIKAT